MEQIINQLINNFDFTLMLVINVATYIAIKFIDELNGAKLPTTLQKRIVLVLMCIIFGIIYYYINETKLIIIVNSCIVAPIAWGWLAKPIASRLGIDYKKQVK